MLFCHCSLSQSDLIFIVEIGIVCLFVKIHAIFPWWHAALWAQRGRNQIRNLWKSNSHDDWNVYCMRKYTRCIHQQMRIRFFFIFTVAAVVLCLRICYNPIMFHSKMIIQLNFFPNDYTHTQRQICSMNIIFANLVRLHQWFIAWQALLVRVYHHLYSLQWLNSYTIASGLILISLFQMVHAMHRTSIVNTVDKLTHTHTQIYVHGIAYRDG